MYNTNNCGFIISTEKPQNFIQFPENIWKLASLKNVKNEEFEFDAYYTQWMKDIKFSGK